ncbi:hypothetical protein [Protaetiibacter intestinalis]|uniref:HTH luxR-type domain-containing protein n=1 Tax=Protaetiibacter intestinalis TaxID=2419774 RepID=A0A387B6V9_9MICO|nr:hypothetical protein [Protaetiibacter intestinalis]AYF96806.1 hypothetical protein D7I47_00070 [Protaetiibacter intestinalis]
MSQIGHAEPHPPLAHASLELLAMALRARPTTVTELAILARATPAELRDRLAVLVELDLLALRGDDIGYRPPAQTVAALSARVLGDAAHALTTSLAEVDTLLTALPGLITSDLVGSPDGTGGGRELFHGPGAAHDLWRSLILQQHERRSACMMPDARPVLVPDSPLSDAWRDTLGEAEMQVRAILSLADMTRPESRPMLEAARASGVEFRAMRTPPSWFWLTDEAVGLPLRWGDPWPTSALLLRDEAVVSLMQGLYDTWWAQAATLAPTAHPWDAVLALMVDGATLEAASHAVGISSRTGRRRIEAAMDHYGVVGAVALGAAWQRERALSAS